MSQLSLSTTKGPCNQLGYHSLLFCSDQRLKHNWRKEKKRKEIPYQ